MKRFKKFSILFLVDSTLFLSAFAQQFHNLDFREFCDSSKTGLCYWDLSWGGKGSVRSESIDRKNCLMISGIKESSVGFAEQASTYDISKGLALIQLSAFISSDEIEGKGAGLNIGLYDEEGKLVGTRDMGGFYSLDWIRGTNGWKKYSISIVSPSATAKIKIGAILYGKGNAYFKDYDISILPIGSRHPSKLAIQYIDAVCDTIHQYSLVKDSIDITALKKIALQIAGDAKSYSDCYTAVNYLLESLRPFGDEHSFFMKAAEAKNWEKGGSEISKIRFPEFKIIENCGYISVPPFHGGNQQQILAFADSLQKGIKTLYDANIKGWIVDLRQNTGGNMAPMVAGLGPLFSSEKLGSLINVEDKPNSWYYKNGKYFWDDDPGWTVSNPVNLPNKLPIAILTDGQTGSSGEAVVVSFIGNARTMLIGQPTWGLTTGNQNFRLIDGSEIFLASTIYADRNGNRYASSISPDLIVVGKAGGDKDLVIDAATTWISAQN